MQTLQAAAPKSAPSMPYPDLSFITFSDPGQSRLPRQRKAVRSHAASYQYQLDKAAAAKHASGTRKRARRRKPQAPITLEINGLVQVDGTNRIMVPHSPSPLGILSEGRVDPFHTYPIPWEPSLPELIDHCMCNF